MVDLRQFQSVPCIGTIRCWACDCKQKENGIKPQRERSKLFFGGVQIETFLSKTLLETIVLPNKPLLVIPIHAILYLICTGQPFGTTIFSFALDNSFDNGYQLVWMGGCMIKVASRFTTFAHFYTKGDDPNTKKLKKGYLLIFQVT